jgi:putative peptidoglycan lipid II flippase
MMKRVLLMLYKRTSGINEAAFLLGIFTLISQILGLVRDRIFAGTIGPGPILDAYYASFKVPDFLYVSLASLASVTVILPMLSQKFRDGASDNRKSAHVFFNQIFTVFSFTLFSVSIILFICMPWVAKLIVPGFPPESLHNVIWMSRIMLLSPIIFGISTMIGSVTQMFQKFLIYALAPIMYNAGIIVGALVLYPLMGQIGLALGVILGAALHLGIQVPLLLQESFVPKFTFTINWKEIKNIIKTSLPRTVGLSMSSFTAIILVAIISGFSPGTMSIFTFAFNLQSVPIGVIGISYSVASFPILVRFFQENELEKFTTTILQTLRKIIFWSLPIMALFIVLRAQIVRVLLGTGSFSWNDTRLTAGVLALFVFGIIAQSIVHVLVRAYYAAGNTWKPLIMNFLGEVITIGAAYGLLALFAHMDGFRNFFEHVLRLEGVAETRLTMVALAFTIGNVLNMILLGIIFHVNFKLFVNKTAHKTLIRSTCNAVLSATVMGGVGYYILNATALWFNQDRFWGILGQGAVAGIFGLGAGIIVLKLLRDQDLNEFIKTIKGRFWKAKVVQDTVGTGVDVV